MGIQSTSIEFPLREDTVFDVGHNCIDDPGDIMIAIIENDREDGNGADAVLIHLTAVDALALANLIAAEVVLHGAHQAETKAEVAEGAEELERLANEEDPDA